MLSKLSFDDVHRRGGYDDVFVKWSDVRTLLEEILEANSKSYSKYDINQIMKREGLKISLTTR